MDVFGKGRVLGSEWQVASRRCAVVGALELRPAEREDGETVETGQWR